LCPLSEIQLPAEVLERDLHPVWRGQQLLTRITRVAATGKRQHIADAYERREPLTVAGAGEAMTWTERRLVVRSRQLARAGEVVLRARRAKAQVALATLNEQRRGKKRFAGQPVLQEAAETILRQYRVQGLLAVRYTERVQEHQLRRYDSRPTTVRVERAVRVIAVLDRRAVAAAIGRLGWRVYATNAPPAPLSLAQAVLAYRSEYLIEPDMGRLKGQPLSLTPMNLERDDHATGLIRLLLVGLRVLAGLYAGNPKRGTVRPTAERLLERFRGLTLTIIREGRRRRYHLTPLSPVQQRILALLGFRIDIYTKLCVDSHKLP
jgi:transposase